MSKHITEGYSYNAIILKSTSANLQGIINIILLYFIFKIASCITQPSGASRENEHIITNIIE